MRKCLKIIAIPMLTLTLLICTGCWSRREPDSLAVLNSVLVDMQDDKYSYLFEIMDPSPPIGEKDKGGSGNSIYASGTGSSLIEVLRSMTDSLDRRIYVGHVEARFLSEPVAKKGISTVLDFFLRVHKIRQNPFLIVIKGDNPELIYECETGMADNLGTYIIKMSKIQMRATGHSVFVKTLDFIKDYYKEGKEPVMGTAEAVENPNMAEESKAENKGKNYLLKYTGLAAFKDDKLVGYLDDIEARAYNMIVGDIMGGYISIPSTGKGDNLKGTVVELSGIKHSIKIDYEKQLPEITVKFNVGLSLSQEAFPVDIHSKEYKEEIQRAFEALLEKQIQDTIKKVQGMGSDIFGFGSEVHIKYPKKWPEIKDRWNEIFSQSDIKVKVEAKIISVGELKESFLGEE